MTPYRPLSFAPPSLGALFAALLALGPKEGLAQAGAVALHGNAAQSYAWTTFAGTPGVHGMNPGTGPSARFGDLTSAAADASGNLYVTDVSNYVVWKVTPAGVASVFANFAPTTQGAISFANAVAVAPSGNIYLFDGRSVLMATPGGSLSTVADITGMGPPYADGPPNEATLGSPTALVVDSSGNVYFTDATYSTVRELSDAALVSTIAGLASQFGDLDGTGSAARFTHPNGITMDASGDLFVTDSDAVRKIAPGGVVTTLAGQGDAVGYADGTGSAARFYNTNGIAIDAGANLYVTVGDNTIRMVTPAGIVSTIGGTSNATGSSNGVGSSALFNGPNGIAVDPAGDIFVVDEGNAVIRKVYNASPAAPAITSQPASLSVAIGASATFTVAATGVPAPTYQWLLDGNYVAGATNPSLTISSVQSSNLGSYTVVVSNASGSATSSAATLSSPGVTPTAAPAPATLVNISTRAQVSTGADVEIVGFVVSGPPGSTEQLLVRGDGVSLASLGVAGTLGQPVLTLFDVSGKQVATNTNYTTSPNESQIIAAGNASGAFPLVQMPIGSVWDSALLVTLPPGTYTAVVSPDDGNPGIALAELYAVGTNSAQLVNISTRAFVGTGAQIAIAGMSIAGSQPTTVLIRAVGPTLSQFSVGGSLAQPVLTVIDNAGNVVATNTGWTNNANASQIALAATATGAFALPNPSNDSALLLTLQPGNYTATVSGAGGTSGVALVEVYQLP
jgi:sugar lactone lactonase YvrE